jgi:hypothetical protein
MDGDGVFGFRYSGSQCWERDKLAFAVGVRGYWGRLGFAATKMLAHQGNEFSEKSPSVLRDV